MLEKEIFEIQSQTQFETIAMQVFKYQYKHVAIYRNFCDHLKKKPSNTKELLEIPFLPIEFFKSEKIISAEKEAQLVFSSSGTTGAIPSKHHVADRDIYTQSFTHGFKKVYGNPEQYVILALLPSYLEREDSSLIYMFNELIRQTKQPMSGFYLDEIDSLIKTLKKIEEGNQKTILLGVSYALLDLIEKSQFQFKNISVMETGGMKGRRKEMVKPALHKVLRKGFGVSHIHSEYGMTELLSQAYSTSKGRFHCPPWMKVLTRDTNDALSFVQGATGGINVIDLANLYSCSFIATQDLGKVNPDTSFEILGRFDTSDIRGCNLMIS